MNLKNLNKLIAHLERISKPTARPKVGFNMADFYGRLYGGDLDNSGHNCGTVACIAGHAALLAGGSPNNSDTAREWLELEDDDLVDELFFAIGPTGGDVTLSEVPISKAIAVLRHLAATGEVDWTIPDEAA